MEDNYKLQQLNFYINKSCELNMLFRDMYFGNIDFDFDIYYFRNLMLKSKFLMFLHNAYKEDFSNKTKAKEFTIRNDFTNWKSQPKKQNFLRIRCPRDIRLNTLIDDLNKIGYNYILFDEDFVIDIKRR